MAQQLRTKGSSAKNYSRRRSRGQDSLPVSSRAVFGEQRLGLLRQGLVASPVDERSSCLF